MNLVINGRHFCQSLVVVLCAPPHNLSSEVYVTLKAVLPHAGTVFCDSTSNWLARTCIFGPSEENPVSWPGCRVRDSDFPVAFLVLQEVSRPLATCGVDCAQHGQGARATLLLRCAPSHVRLRWSGALPVSDAAATSDDRPPFIVVGSGFMPQTPCSPHACPSWCSHRSRAARRDAAAHLLFRALLIDGVVCLVLVYVLTVYD